MEADKNMGKLVINFTESNNKNWVWFYNKLIVYIYIFFFSIFLYSNFTIYIFYLKLLRKEIYFNILSFLFIWKNKVF
jgi:hypothetical protein